MWTDFPFSTLLCSALAGSFGGFVASINISRANEILCPIKNRRIRLGFVGDMCIGLAASLAIHFAANALMGTAVQERLTAEDYIKVISVGILAGVAGNRLLTGLSDTVLNRVLATQQQLEVKVDLMDRVNELIREGETDLREGRFDIAESVFRRVIQMDNKSVVAYVDLGKALKRRALATGDERQRFELLQEAIDMATRALEIEPRYDRALYNRACYKALSGVAANEVLADLAAAIASFEPYRSVAPHDRDFERVSEDPGFRSLVL